MVEDQKEVDRVFHALSNQTRRGMVRQLSGGECSVGDLARPTRMSFAAASKHVQVLEKAGMVNRRVEGRQHICSLRPDPLREASEWLSFYEKFWAGNLDRLARVVEADMKKEKK
ncbi:MAG TPA: metalloregulator ArsR/SmtB family transcription factor [Solirubrobacterales bacterium]|jgi:DNA-binding transcriptional ArsR family regulator|nr:metalloregulator ArsR/SmtB family transcription factor [Solirubrobacterales bacterium]HMU25923.1 metalloregulator ArsR/SmtB family transcription factor [Solirubrobacterales bacterium]HMX72011.1 metalloregulator ArsR/SmtB family transcription factor [Solirubrobacterales bacterium]HMY25274.1 metalloregulator ArsR/SmtB family transcription factor [Solirubrobacterales bacterium]HNA23777.1 metalloregulator ArsR/SmtB family transcription factor [Solirubrobacterales bacterium]